MKILDFDGGTGIDLLLAVQDLKPDVVVLPLLEDDHEPGICSHLLEQFSDLVIVAISRCKIRRLSKTSVLWYSERALLDTIRMAP